jgi:hypothetical protein
MVLIDCFAKTNQEVVKADTHGALKQIDCVRENMRLPLPTFLQNGVWRRAFSAEKRASAKKLEDYHMQTLKGQTTHAQ